MSVWVAAPFAMLLEQGWKERGMLWLALSGGAILLERMSAEQIPVPHGFYMEDVYTKDKETDDVLR
jgi:hypothetical protein